jgi:hypothetical protein
MVFNINTFVKAGGLIPGGFTGLTLFIQEIARRFWDLRLPFSVIYYCQQVKKGERYRWQRVDKFYPRISLF